jgi:hypothetical protein
MKQPDPMVDVAERRQVIFGLVEFLTDDMTVREILETLDGLAHRRDDHALVLDRRVRQFISDILRERLPRRQPEVTAC